MSIPNISRWTSAKKVGKEDNGWNVLKAIWKQESKNVQKHANSSSQTLEIQEGWIIPWQKCSEYKIEKNEILYNIIISIICLECEPPDLSPATDTNL